MPLPPTISNAASSAVSSSSRRTTSSQSQEGAASAGAAASPQAGAEAQQQQQQPQREGIQVAALRSMSDTRIAKFKRLLDEQVSLSVSVQRTVCYAQAVG